jgi:hypothetical protein
MRLFHPSGLDKLRSLLNREDILNDMFIGFNLTQ